MYRTHVKKNYHFDFVMLFIFNNTEIMKLSEQLLSIRSENI